MRSRARAEIDGGCWSFTRRGFLQRRVTVRVCDTEADIAVFKDSCGLSGTLVLADGREIKMRSKFWRSRHAFVDAADQLLIRFTSSHLFRMSGQMEILPAAETVRHELPWLVMLAWYFAVMMRRDTAAAT